MMNVKFFHYFRNRQKQQGNIAFSLSYIHQLQQLQTISCNHQTGATFFLTCKSDQQLSEDLPCVQTIPKQFFCEETPFLMKSSPYFCISVASFYMSDNKIYRTQLLYCNIALQRLVSGLSHRQIHTPDKKKITLTLRCSKSNCVLCCPDSDIIAETNSNSKETISCRYQSCPL